MLHDAGKMKLPTLSILRDAERKFHLDQLVTEVKNAGNVVVLLSDNYPRRPFTLVELHKALIGGANVVAVKVVKEKMESFSLDHVGKAVESHEDIKPFLTADDWQLVLSQGLVPAEVRWALKRVMNVRGFTLSLEKPQSVRIAIRRRFQDTGDTLEGACLRRKRQGCCSVGDCRI